MGRKRLLKLVWCQDGESYCEQTLSPALARTTILRRDPAARLYLGNSWMVFQMHCLTHAEVSRCRRAPVVKLTDRPGHEIVVSLPTD